MTSRHRPRRTLLYVSGDIERHMEKAPGLPADAVIYDLFEAVAPQFKGRARDKVRAALGLANPLAQERVLRVNPPASGYLEDDLALAVSEPVDAVLLSGLRSGAEVTDAVTRLDALGGGALPLMLMIDSPLAVLNAEQMVAASGRIACLVVSNANLMVSMRMPPTEDRSGLFTSLALVVLAARAHDVGVVDGAHLDIQDSHACEYACRQSRDFGFDGKAVIHPAQLTYTNDAFTPRPRDIERRRAIVAAMEAAHRAGRSYAVLEGRLLQPSELDAARRCLAVFEAIEARRRAYEGMS